METKICYICNIQTTLYSKNLIETKSEHTNTPIADFISKFLGNYPSYRNWGAVYETKITDERFGCIECIAKINEYDLACVTAERIENELREILLLTVALHKPHSPAVNHDNEEFFTSKIEQIEVLAELVDDYKNDDENSIDKLTEIEADFLEDDADGLDNINIDDNCFTEDIEISLDGSTISKGEEKFEDFISGKCDMIVESNEALQNNEANSKQPKFKCLTCTETFQSREKYEIHKNQHKDDEDRCKCSVCGLHLKDEIKLVEHKTLHRDVPALQCVFCRKTFKVRGGLVRHMRIHSGLAFYQCDKCGKLFVHKSSFEMHILAHNDIRKKQCPHCDRMFRSSSHLNRHLRIHTGIKPYSCPVCGQKFAQRYNMNVHQRLHDTNIDRSKTDKKHVCSFCHSSFARKSKLNEHYQKSHGAMTPHTAIGNELDDTSYMKINVP